MLTPTRIHPQKGELPRILKSVSKTYALTNHRQNLEYKSNYTSIVGLEIRSIPVVTMEMIDIQDFSG